MSLQKVILLVEDEPDLKELLATELELNGVKVLTSSGGREAFEIFQKNKIDLIVSDLRMNKGGGLDLLKNVRELESSAPMKVPFILMSGFSEFDEAEAIQRGAQHLFHKPFSLTAFADVVKKMLITNTSMGS